MAGRELNPRHADFQSVFGDSRGLSINHLQRLADPVPGTPRHNPGKLNLSWSQIWHSTLDQWSFTIKGPGGQVKVLHPWPGQNPPPLRRGDG